MKHFIIAILAVALILATGCRSLFRSQVDITAIHADHVAYVVFVENRVRLDECNCPTDVCEAPADEFDEPEHYTAMRELFRINDPDAIRELVQELKHTGQRGEVGLSFAGCLPWHFFIGRNDEVLVEVLINHDGGHVSTGRHAYLKDGGLFFSRTEWLGGPDGANRPYVRLVYDLLVKNAPEDITKRDKMFEEYGGLEDMLGINEKKE